MLKYLLLTILLLMNVNTWCHAYVVKIEQTNRLTIHAKNVALQKLLASLQTWGITVKIDPQINPIVSVSFQDRDIQKGLDTLLKSFNHIYIWNAVNGPWGNMPVLCEIQIFLSGRKYQMKPLSQTNNFNISQIPGTKDLYVKNELLIRLGRNVQIDEFLKFLNTMNASIVNSYPSLSIFQIRFPPSVDALDFLATFNKNMAISSVEPNYGYSIPNIQKVSPIKIIPHSDTNNNKRPATKTSIAILDTGLLMNSSLNPYVISSYDTFQPGKDIQDNLGHGTNMANIASGNVLPDGSNPYGEAQQRYIVPIRIFDDSGIVTNAQILKSIDFAEKSGAKVISMSWGSETYSEFLDQAMKDAVSRGMIPIASAGNKPTGKPQYPAAYSSVIGVGALSVDGSPWENSNYGDFVEIYAPGYATFPESSSNWPGRYVGTSISAAFVANQVASYIESVYNLNNQKQYDIYKIIKKFGH